MKRGSITLALILLILSMFSAVQAQTGPGVITSMSPSGTVTSVTYNVGWQHVANAEWYELWILGPSGYVFNYWYPATTEDATRYGIIQEGVCQNTTCSISPKTPLANGQYQMWMRAWGNNVMGDYNTTPFTFTLQIPTPTAPTLLFPEEGSVVSETFEVDLYWQYAPGIQWYHIALVNPAGEITSNWVPATNLEAVFADIPDNAQGFCTTSNGTCGAVYIRRNVSTGQQVPLLQGSYSWWIGAWNPGAGSGIYTEGHFIVSNTAADVFSAAEGVISQP